MYKESTETASISLRLSANTHTQIKLVKRYGLDKGSVIINTYGNYKHKKSEYIKKELLIHTYKRSGQKVTITLVKTPKDIYNK